MSTHNTSPLDATRSPLWTTVLKAFATIIFLPVISGITILFIEYRTGLFIPTSTSSAPDKSPVASHERPPEIVRDQNKTSPKGSLTTERSLELVLVLDTSKGMEPLLQIAKDIVITHLNNEQSLLDSANSVRFGIVEYYHDKASKPSAGIICHLTSNIDILLRSLNTVHFPLDPTVCTDRDLFAGLETAISGLHWDQSSNKNILIFANDNMSITDTTLLEQFTQRRASETKDLDSKLKRLLATKSVHGILGVNSPGPTVPAAARDLLRRLSENDKTTKGFYGEFNINHNNDQKAIVNELNDVISEGISVMRMLRKH